MRLSRVALCLLLLLSLPLMARDVPAISSISPDQLHAMSGEWFATLEGAHFLPTTGMTVVFTGPAGTIALYPNAATDTTLVTWVPSEVLLNPGWYSVKVRVPNGAGVLESNSMPFRVIGTSIFLRVPPQILVEASSLLGGYGRFEVSATSFASENVSVDCSQKSGDLFPFDRTTVDCVATDDTGDSVKESFPIIVADTTPPAINVPKELSVFGKEDGSNVTFDVKASDVVDPDVKVTCAPESGSFFRLGTATVTCSSTDRFKNAATASFRVHVGSEAFPVLILPASLSVDASSRDGATVKYDVSAADANGKPVDFKCEPASGSLFPMGTTTVKCTAWGPTGSATTDVFDIKVGDTSAPRLSLPHDFTEQASTPDGATVKYPASATDAVDGETLVDCSSPTGSFFVTGNTTVTCTSVDKAGNQAKGSFVVTVLPYVDDTVLSVGSVQQ